MRIRDYSIRKLVVPIDAPISDSQTDWNTDGISYMTLETDTGETGVGFGSVSPDLPLSVLRERFESVSDELVGKSPFHLRKKLRRPRGGDYSSAPRGGFDQVVDLALWDLCGKHLDMPLYELLGGTEPSVPAYVSGLHYCQDDQFTRQQYDQYSERGFTAAKVKIGYPTVREDVERLELVRAAMGQDTTLMVDANEAWSPKEAIRRAHAIRDAGFDIYWYEDPVLRADVEGIRDVSESVPFSHVNAGEYVNLEGKRELLEERAVDVLNLRTGIILESLQAATLAHAYGVLTHVGHGPGNVGVHLAAALPESTCVEWWDRPWDGLVQDPVVIEDGRMIAPDRPGHGVTLTDAAVEEYESE